MRQCSIWSIIQKGWSSVPSNSISARRAGRLIGGEAIQLHGGMGMTDELSIGFFVKRLMIINSLFGDADYHQQLFAALVNTPASSAAA